MNDPTYTDKERIQIVEKAAERAREGLPPGVALVVVVATRTPENTSKFESMTNLSPHDAARLMTRAAWTLNKQGVGEVLQHISKGTFQ